MKKTGLLISILILILALLVAGLQWFLTRGLTTVLNEQVFPSIKTSYGLDISITNASVNLFTGSANLNGLTVKNLPGYTEPVILAVDTCRFDVELRSLIKRNPLVIQQIEARGATLIPERNQYKRFNVKELADAIQSKQRQYKPASEPASDAQPAPATSPKKPIPLHIRQIIVETLVKYIDSGRKQTCELNLRLTGRDLFSIPSSEQPDTLLVLRGTLAHNQNAFTTDLSAMIDPLVDPKKPSFNANGSILDIDASFLSDLLSKNKMESSSFSIKPSITCKKGEINGSYLDVVLKQLKVHGTDIGDTTFKLPVNGTLDQPSFDLTGALQSLFSEKSLSIAKLTGLNELRKQLGAKTNATPRDMLVNALTNNAKEFSKSPALQKLMGQVRPEITPVDTNSIATNTPPSETPNEIPSDAPTNNPTITESIQNIGNSLFGK
ncbi:MAG: hypothetical protein FJ220_01090 [Kiritimatiellaceae bacterium]|nr:hypothetical protein [Kiritimatiellaceae bacterium]